MIIKIAGALYSYYTSGKTEQDKNHYRNCLAARLTPIAFRIQMFQMH